MRREREVCDSERGKLDSIDFRKRCVDVVLCCLMRHSQLNNVVTKKISECARKWRRESRIALSNTSIDTSFAVLIESRECYWIRSSRLTVSSCLIVLDDKYSELFLKQTHCSFVSRVSRSVVQVNSLCISSCLIVLNDKYSERADAQSSCVRSPLFKASQTSSYDDICSETTSSCDRLRRLFRAVD